MILTHLSATIHSPIYPMMMELVTLLNGYSLFGKELGMAAIVSTHASPG